MTIVKGKILCDRNGKAAKTEIAKFNNAKFGLRLDTDYPRNNNGGTRHASPTLTSDTNAFDVRNRILPTHRSETNWVANKETVVSVFHKGHRGSPCDI